MDILDNSLKFNIYELHSKYKDPSDIPSQHSGVRSAQSKIDEATSLMKKNIGSMINNKNNLEEIENTSGNLASTANRFKNKAIKLEE